MERQKETNRSSLVFQLEFQSIPRPFPNHILFFSKYLEDPEWHVSSGRESAFIGI